MAAPAVCNEADLMIIRNADSAVHDFSRRCVFQLFQKFVIINIGDINTELCFLRQLFDANISGVEIIFYFCNYFFFVAGGEMPEVNAREIGTRQVLVVIPDVTEKVDLLKS